jgi:cysteinyl-tRNA synthetase
LATIQSSLNNLNENTYAIITRFENDFLKLWLFDIQERSEIPTDIQELAQKRREAKQNKDRTTADKIRDELKSKWYTIKDSGDSYEILKDYCLVNISY